MLDLDHAANQLIALANGTTDDQLAAPTPCAEYTVRELVDHLLDLTLAFRAAADKSPAPAPDQHADWRDQLSTQLRALVLAWRSPAAWTGDTQAGPAPMPAEIAGAVVANELVVHCWDLATATGQHYECDPELVRSSLAMLAGRADQPDPEGFEGLFAPAFPVPADAPPLHRVLGLSGRDPLWTPRP